MENHFKDNIKFLRIKNRLSQEQLAKNLGVSKGLISLWENGLRFPNSETLIAVADYFGVTTDFLLGRED